MPPRLDFYLLTHVTTVMELHELYHRRGYNEMDGWIATQGPKNTTKSSSSTCRHPIIRRHPHKSLIGEPSLARRLLPGGSFYDDSSIWPA